MTIFLSAAAVVTVVGGVFLIMFWRLALRSDAQPPDPVWLNRFSLETYAPMERLLDRTDFAFLASHPGSNPDILKKLLRRRKKLFKKYLGLLARDFNRLVTLGKLMLVHSAEDKAELGHELWRLQLAFYSGLLLVRCKLAIYPWGWTAVDVPRLVHSLDQMGQQVRALAVAHNQASSA